MLGAIYCNLDIIEGLTKSLCRKKLLSFMLWCVPVHHFLHFLLGRPGIICWTYFVRFAKIENQQSLWQSKTLEKDAYAPMHLIMEYLWVPYAWHAWLEQPYLWVCSQAFFSQRYDNSSSLRNMLYWIQGMFVLTTMWPPGNFFPKSNHGAISF